MGHEPHEASWLSRTSKTLTGILEVRVDLRFPGRIAVSDNQSNSSVPVRWLSPIEAALYLGFSVQTLERWRKKGEGPRWFRLGYRRVIYDIADLDAFIQREGN